MSVPLLRPAVNDLIFQLFGRPLHPELFDILAERKVRHEDYEVWVRITRTGHVISFENADVHLTEMTAAGDQPLPSKRRLLSYRLRQEQCATLACAHGIHYQTSFQVEVLPPDLFLHVHDEIKSDGNKRGLLSTFPSRHRLTVAPLGFVTVEARPRCLFFSSFHTFPGENTVVKTQSLIEKK
jgi:Protein of unknown function DUF2617